MSFLYPSITSRDTQASSVAIRLYGTFAGVLGVRDARGVGGVYCGPPDAAAAVVCPCACGAPITPTASAAPDPIRLFLRKSRRSVLMRLSVASTNNESIGTGPGI